jgi:hypothetical protein
VANLPAAVGVRGAYLDLEGGENGGTSLMLLNSHFPFVKIKAWVKELRRIVGDKIAINIAGNERHA